MEVLQGLDVAAVCGPGFTAIEEGSDADSFINSNIGVQVEVAVVRKDSASQAPKDSWYMVLNFVVGAAVLRKDTAKIFEGRSYR